MPRKSSKTITFVVGALVLVVVSFMLFMLRFSNEPETQIYHDSPLLVDTNDPFVTQRLTEKDLLPDDIPLITFLDPARGSQNAPITLVEFSDFQCPSCKDARSIVDTLLKRYPDSIRHIWKDAPSTSIHPQSFNAHIAARCAQDQNAFWEYHDRLFENQNNLTRDIFLSIARDIGLNTRAWERCYDTAETQARVERSITEAEVLGVDATPYFFINEMRISGSVSLEKLDQMIRNKLPL